MTELYDFDSGTKYTIVNDNHCSSEPIAGGHFTRRWHTWTVLGMTLCMAVQ